MPENQPIPIRRQSVSVPDFVAKSQSESFQSKEINKYPTEKIPLVTKGWMYNEGTPLSSGEIEIKQMTAKEEDILANQELIRKGKVLDKLMESLIVDKSIKLNDILLPDKNAIFIAIRRFAYGDEYFVTITCPHCLYENKVKINLGELLDKPFNFDEYPKGHNNFTFKLPHSGITLTYKILSHLDEQSIDAELNQLKKISKENTGELTTRLKYLITSVDGNSDRTVIRKFIDERLSARDSLSFRKHIKENIPDVDMSFNFHCSECDNERRVDVPINTSFLWPDIES